MLKRRKESNTYLATFHRHCWCAQITMKTDKILELSASTSSSADEAVHSGDVYGKYPGSCRSLPSFLKYLFIIFPGFPFILILSKK